MDKSKPILIASDHNGSESRKFLRTMLLVDGWNVVDMGPVDDGKVDYVDYARLLANAVSVGKDLRGILVCGTGVGMSIAANRFQGVRASLVHSLDVARLTREHNDSNVVCLGSWKNTDAELLDIVNTWLGTEFGEGRHQKRVEKLGRRTDRIVLVPGVFDIIHPGHIELFRFARSMGKVVVAINDNASSLKIKPQLLNDVLARCAVVMQLSLVDEVIVFDGNVSNAVTETGASVVVKGSGVEKAVRDVDMIPEGVEVKILPEVGGYSVSSVKGRMR